MINSFVVIAKSMSSFAEYLTVAIFAWAGSSALAAQSQEDTYIDRLNDSSYVAYLSTNFQHFQSELPDVNWQWAACLQIIFNREDIAISQKEIIRTLYSIQSGTVSLPDLIKDMDNWYLGGKKTEVRKDSVSFANIKHHLAFGRPMIVLYQQGDAIFEPCILSACFYHISENGEVPDRVVVRHAGRSDAESRAEYSWDEFNRLFFPELICITF